MVYFQKGRVLAQDGVRQGLRASRSSSLPGSFLMALDRIIRRTRELSKQALPRTDAATEVGSQPRLAPSTTRGVSELPSLSGTCSRCCPWVGGRPAQHLQCSRPTSGFSVKGAGRLSGSGSIDITAW